MSEYCLRVKLLSDATFGRGDGVPGLVDQEVEHDTYGLPTIHGRTLKGLLVDACAEILYGLSLADDSPVGKAAAWLFGYPGSRIENTGKLHVGMGQLPRDIADYFITQVTSGVLTRDEVLSGWTAIRRQTAMDEKDVPTEGSLRSQRVVIRLAEFESALTFASEPEHIHLQLLSACAAGVQRGGSGRTRGRGRLKVSLESVHESAQFLALSYDSLFERVAR